VFCSNNLLHNGRTGGVRVSTCLVRKSISSCLLIILSHSNTLMNFTFVGNSYIGEDSCNG
jgi:hypothetical protein